MWVPIKEVQINQHAETKFGSIKGSAYLNNGQHLWCFSNSTVFCLWIKRLSWDSRSIFWMLNLGEGSAFYFCNSIFYVSFHWMLTNVTYNLAKLAAPACSDFLFTLLHLSLCSNRDPTIMSPLWFFLSVARQMGGMLLLCKFMAWIFTHSPIMTVIQLHDH